MARSTCQGCHEQFNRKVAAKDLRDYRRNGPKATAGMLVEALASADVKGMTLLDIGGGVGAVQHGLLEAGAARATGVDASPAYLDAARREAARRGLAERVSLVHGDFVTVDAEEADIVTLDRVICCYPDAGALVARSADHARRLYGIVYPRLTVWTKLLFAALNFSLRLRRSTFRAYLHAPPEVDRLIRDRGFTRLSQARTLTWQVVVYSRN